MRLVIIHVLDYPTVLGTKGLGEPFPHLEETAFKNHRAKLEEFCEQNLETDWQKRKGLEQELHFKRPVVID